MAKAANASRYYGTGRRKKSIARVYLTPGTGNITVNKRGIDEYFGLETLKVIVRQPLAATDTVDKFDTWKRKGWRLYRTGRCHQTRNFKSIIAGRCRLQTSAQKGRLPDT